MINDNNYFVVQAYMINKMGLKGNELIVFSIINGFSQAEGTRFTGSLQYLCDWTGLSKQGIINILKSLVEKKYILKDEWYDNGVKRVAYTSNYLNRVVKKVDWGSQVSLPGLSNNLNGGIQETLPNNITNNKEDNIEDNISSVVEKPRTTEAYSKAVRETIEYLNTVCHKNFKPLSTGPNAAHIIARLKEGFTVDDFKKVIDYKYKQWGENPKFFSNGLSSEVYLRPQTLFSNKFDSYLNEIGTVKIVNNKKKVFTADEMNVEPMSENDLAELRKELFGE